VQIVTTHRSTPDTPVLFVDVDGVISLFDFELDKPPPGHFHTVDGIAHFISGTAGEHLLELERDFELVWCTGWEEKANEYLPRLLGLRGTLPFLTFDSHHRRSASGAADGGSDAAADGSGAADAGATVGRASGHWKLAAIDAYASSRPLAWVDDGFTEACERWAGARSAPTLLVSTVPARGLRSEHVSQLRTWASGLRADAKR
jgi:hypothetical protein